MFFIPNPWVPSLRDSTHGYSRYATSWLKNGHSFI